MKCLPIRCRPGDTKPIRAIAWQPTSAPLSQSTAIAIEKARIRDVCPTHQFITDLKDTIPKSCVDLLNTFDEIAKNGIPLNDTKFSVLQNGIYEFKAWKARVACFFDGNVIICTHGFYKKQQTTPKGEIAYAEKLRGEYDKAKAGNYLIYV